MALVEKWLQTANNSAYHQSIFGTLAAGGGSGTEGSPWSTWGQANTEIITAGTLTDELIVNVHPAACIADSLASSLWTGLGRTGFKYTSITIRRWQAIVDGDARYEDWKPTAEGNLFYPASGAWTQGSVSGGVWSAGAGDVYKLTSAIVGITFATALRHSIRCWGGHQFGDNVQDPTIRLVNCAGQTDAQGLSAMVAEGDWCHLTTGGTNLDLYVKTGAVGVDPTTRWTYFCYLKANGNINSVWLQNCKNITFTDFRWHGAPPYLSQSVATRNNENLTFTRPVHRMGNHAFYTLDSTLDVYQNNVFVDEPDFQACTHPTQIDKGPYATTTGSSEGILSYTSKMTRFRIRNPKVIGYGHAGIAIAHSASGLGDTTTRNTYPRGVEIIVDDYSNGKSTITCGPGYKRALAIQTPGYTRVGPLKIREQRIQSQFDGFVDFVGLHFDDSNVYYADEYPPQTSGFGGSSHINFQGVVSGYTFRRIRFIGCRFYSIAQQAICWGNDAPAGVIETLGCLIYDGGQTRGFPNTDAATYAARTRHIAPILGESGTFADAGPLQIVKGNMFDLNAACVAAGSAKIAASTPAAAANGTNYPLVQATDTAWGGFWSGNQEGILAEFGFDTAMNYTGPRKTPIQTTPRSGRGYN